MNEIIPRLYLGNIISSQDEIGLRHIDRIVAIIDQPLIHMRRPGIHIYLPDDNESNIRVYFDEVFRYIDRWRDNGLNVLVHCYAGVSRSATLVIYYIMRKYEINYDQAFKAVRHRRPIIQPNPNFVRQLKMEE